MGWRPVPVGTHLCTVLRSNSGSAQYKLSDERCLTELLTPGPGTGWGRGARPLLGYSLSSLEYSHGPHQLTVCSGLCGHLAMMRAISLGPGPQESDSRSGAGLRLSRCASTFPFPISS